MNVTKYILTLPSVYTDIPMLNKHIMLHNFDSLNKQHISLRVNKTPHSIHVCSAKKSSNPYCQKIHDRCAYLSYEISKISSIKLQTSSVACLIFSSCESMADFLFE